MSEELSKHLAGEGELKAGTILNDRYTIKKVIGKGGMATVYLAEDIFSDNDLVAIKILRADFVNNKSYVERFCSEVIILNKINHPNVVHFVDANQDKATKLVFYVMEYIDGESLYDIMQRSSFSTSEITKIILGVCDGLHAIHKGEFIHRDIKPDNIMIDYRGVIKIADFGIAKQLNSNRRITTKIQKVGSMCYMAPEMWLGGHIDSTADIYALGVVIYQMVYKKLPFDGDTVRELMDQHIEEKVKYPEEIEVPVWLKELIVNCLEKDYTKRPQTVDDIINFMLEHADDDVRSSDITKGQSSLQGEEEFKRKEDIEKKLDTPSGSKAFCLMRATRNIGDDELYDNIKRKSLVIQLPVNRQRTISIEIEKPSLDFLFLGLFLISLLVMDGVLTCFGIQESEIHLEANPLMAYFMGIFGLKNALFVTKGFAIILVGIMIYLAKHQRWIKNVIATLSCIYAIAAVIPWVFVLSYYN